jgi:hypothetical protein
MAFSSQVKHVHVAHWVWQNLAVVVLAIVAIGGTYLAVQVNNNSQDARELAQQNAQRILDIDRESKIRDFQIKRSSVRACRLIYGSFPKVFNPLVPPPKLRSVELRNQMQRFRAVIQGLQATCPKQTTGGQP